MRGHREQSECGDFFSVNCNSIQGAKKHTFCFWGLGTELTLGKVVEVGRPDGNMGREGDEGEPAMTVAGARIPQPPSSWP